MGDKVCVIIRSHDRSLDGRTAFVPGDYRRLTELKARYDPHVLFHCNHAIPPSTGGN